MKNKTLKKVGGILLAGVMSLPMFVSADASVCEGKARYYFDDIEVISWVGDGGGATDGNKNNGVFKNGNTTKGVTDASNIGFTWKTNFPKIDKKDFQITTTSYDTVENNVDSIKEWLNMVADTAITDMTNGAVIADSTSTTEKVYEHYLHGSWATKLENTGGAGTIMYATDPIENPVYVAGILKRIQMYEKDNSTSGIYDKFVDEYIASIIDARANIIPNNGVHTSFEIERSFDGDLTAKTNPTGSTVVPLDLSYWSIFQHYDSASKKFINPTTGEEFAGDFADLANPTIENNKPVQSVAEVYYDWYMSEEEGGYKHYTDNCNKGTDTSVCIQDASGNDIKIWSPGPSTWINNFATTDRTYTYDCSTPSDSGNTTPPENEEKNTKTGIPSYGYLAIVLAGAAGVYALAKKRSKFIKF